jgi:hypothetical protein
MIPMKLTENHYINPEAIDQVLIRPKTDERPAALCIVFSDDNQMWKLVTAHANTLLKP